MLRNSSATQTVATAVTGTVAAPSENGVVRHAPRACMTTDPMRGKRKAKKNPPAEKFTISV